MEPEEKNHKSSNGNMPSQDVVSTQDKPDIPLDWTELCVTPPRKIRLPRDVWDYDSDETELIIVGTAGHKITKMGSDLSPSCPNLTILTLRSHVIVKMEGMELFTKLTNLELYDNAIEILEGLENLCPSLRILDMSYNVIRDMKPVEKCTNLVELYLAQNKLKNISGLQNLSRLLKLDLGANRIRVMDSQELSGMVNLEELWLGKNKIENIDGVENLRKLKRLDVQANRLKKIDNLSSQVDTLEELYLSHNGISNEGAMLGLSLPFSKLTTLDLSRNCLTSTEPFKHLYTLEELWLSGNEIATFEDVLPIQELGKRCLECICLEYNPVSKEFDYRKRLKEILPSLNQIDADQINPSCPFGGVGKIESIEEKMRKMQQKVFDRANDQKDEKNAAKGV